MTTRASTKYPESYDLPNIDVLTLLFESDRIKSQEDTRLHIDAENPSHFVTKAQARSFTKRIAHGLRYQYGIGASGPGKDVVAAFSTGQYMLPVAFYGVAAAGGVYSAASPGSTVSELARQIREGEAKVLICSPDLKETAIAAAKASDIPLSNLLVLDSGAKPSLVSVESGKSCISNEQLDWERITDPHELENRVLCLLYSSGTTGLPKGVCMSHLNSVSEGMIPVLMVRTYEAQGGKSYPYRTLAHLPASHVAGLQGYFVNPAVYGGETYWMKGFDFLKFLEYMKKHQITFIFTVPPILLLIAKSDLVKDHLDSLEVCIGGAAPLGKELQLAASKKLGKGRCIISQTWGLSETTGSVTVLPRGWNDYTGSVSVVIPNNKLKIFDDDGNDITHTGKPGELVVKGPIVAKKYYKNEKATREAFTKDGWFKSGDVGFVKDGLVYVVDRKKELIKYKGQQVAPAELEALLLSHPLISDAAVIGINGEATELPRAYVVADQAQISEEDIKNFVKGKVASYKQLRGGVVFLPAIPKSPSGKILRKDLRALAAKEEKKARL